MISNQQRTHFSSMSVRVCALFLLFFSSCTFASLKQIKKAVKDGYISGYMQRGIDRTKLKKLRQQEKWRPYKLDCVGGSPKASSGEVKVPCRLGDALEVKFIQLLGSCGITSWLSGQITSIPKVLQDNLALTRNIKSFDGVSLFRLFRFVFLQKDIQEFANNRNATKRFLKRNVLGSKLHLSSARGFNSASYRQTCNSLVQSTLQMGVNVSLLDLKSALKSQFKTQGYRELLVFQGVFTSPLHKAIELPDNNPNKWFTRFHLWLAYKRFARQKRATKALKYLKSVSGVATFETQRSSRKIQLNAHFAGKGGIKFVSGSAKIKAEYVGAQRFDFKGFSTLIFQQKSARSRYDAEFSDLPTPQVIRDELQTKNFHISPNLSFLVPHSEYDHQLSVEGMPVELCKRNTWMLLSCRPSSERFAQKIQRQHCASSTRKRWISQIRLEEIEFTSRSKQRAAPSCRFKIRYKTLQPKDLKERYSLRYILVGKGKARIHHTALLIPHRSEYDLNAHPQLRVDKSFSSLKPEFVGAGNRNVSLRWKIPIEVEDGKNRITKVKRPENFTIICHGKKKMESHKQLKLKERPKRLVLSFGTQLEPNEKVHVVRGKWDPAACTLEFRVKLLVEEKRLRAKSPRRRRRRRRGRRTSQAPSLSGKVREIERIIRTHFLYPVFEANATPQSKKEAPSKPVAPSTFKAPNPETSSTSKAPMAPKAPARPVAPKAPARR